MAVTFSRSMRRLEADRPRKTLLFLATLSIFGALWAVWLTLEIPFLVGGAVFGSARYVLPLAVPLAFAVDRAWQRRGSSQRNECSP